VNGIVFFKTKDLKRLRKFYEETVGCSIWMDQGDCVIFSHGEFLFGFCNRESIDKCGIITFFYNEKSDVDRLYDKFKHISDNEPRDNPKYPIYHFFTKDPEGRILEFQYFYNL